MTNHLGPMSLGLLLGVISVIVPDHLIVLVTLGLSKQSPTQSFSTGAAWGFGHCTGMLMVLALSFPMAAMMHQDGLDAAGDYLAGVLLILVGLYFLLKESCYLEQQQDGSYTVQPCSCDGCGSAMASAEAGTIKGFPAGPGHPFVARASVAHDQDFVCGTCCEAAETDEEKACTFPAETTALLVTNPHTSSGDMNFKGAVLGLLQGLFCPGCVIGVGFAVSSSSGIMSLLLLSTAFVLSTTLFTGLSSVAVTLVGNWGTKSCMSRLSLYRCSCATNVALGIAWIVLNRFGMLHIMEIDNELLRKLKLGGHPYHHHHHHY